MIYDFIIIGGGIAGLYTAYNLIKNDKSLKILIIEKNNYLGGRIKTVHEEINSKIFNFESGAGRFNDNHKLLLNLINELGLSKKIVKIGSDIKFYPSTNYKTKEHKIFIGNNPFKYILKVVKYATKYYKISKIYKKNIQKYTFIEFAKKILNKYEIKFILDSLGYYKQLVSMNAYNAIHLFSKGMNSYLQFYGLKDGLSQIIDKLYLKIKKNCTIKLKEDIVDLEYDKESKYFYVNKIYKTKKCILAIPKPELLKFNILSKNIKTSKLLKSTGYKSLCRIYAVFEKKDIWFKDIPKTTTNNNSRYIIPLDKENGSIMIAYSDSKYADYWNNLYKTDKKKFLQEIKNNIYKTFGIKIANPIFLKPYYWMLGTNYWKKNKDSSILSKKILQPDKLMDLYICGENYSENQGWIEGALETSLEIIKQMN